MPADVYSVQSYAANAKSENCFKSQIKPFSVIFKETQPWTSCVAIQIFLCSALCAPPSAPLLTSCFCSQSSYQLLHSGRHCRRGRRMWTWLTGSWSGSCATPLSSKVGASSRPKVTLSVPGGRAPSPPSVWERGCTDEAIFLPCLSHTQTTLQRNGSE